MRLFTKALVCLVSCLTIFKSAADPFILLFSPKSTGASGAGIRLAYAEILEDAQEAVVKVFKKADRYVPHEVFLDEGQLEELAELSGRAADPLYDRYFRIVSSYKGSELLGHSIEHTVSGKWGPIRYLLSINPRGEIADVTVLEYRERRGRPISRRRFTRQFEGKDIADPIKFKTDIIGVTGASISSKGITDGIKKALYVCKKFFQ